MTKKDYSAIAKAIRDSTRQDLETLDDYLDVYALVDNLCIVFKRDNPGFDKNKFAWAVYNG